MPNPRRWPGKKIKPKTLCKGQKGNFGMESERKRKKFYGGKGAEIFHFDKNVA